MELTVNGDKRELPPLQNVFELLKHFGLDSKILVVELNREIINRNEYENTPIQNGDQVEIVHFVGGG